MPRPDLVAGHGRRVLRPVRQVPGNPQCLVKIRILEAFLHLDLIAGTIDARRGVVAGFEGIGHFPAPVGAQVAGPVNACNDPPWLTMSRTPEPSSPASNG